MEFIKSEELTVMTSCGVLSSKDLGVEGLVAKEILFKYQYNNVKEHCYK